MLSCWTLTRCSRKRYRCGVPEEEEVEEVVVEAVGVVGVVDLMVAVGIAKRVDGVDGV